MPPKSQADFLALLDRVYPDSYLAPLKTGSGPGYEVLQGYAAVGARVATAIDRLDQGGFFGTAQGAARATVVVQFLRPAGGPLPLVTVGKGTIVSTSQGKRQFVCTTDAQLGVGSLGPVNCAAQALAPGFQYNVTGQRTAANGETLPGEIDTIDLLYTDPPYGDPTITVQQVDDAAGGRDAYLDGLAGDRGIERNTGEPDPSYRARAQAIADTISPDAIQRQLGAILSVFPGVTWRFIETFQGNFCGCYDMPNLLADGSTPVPPIFVPDDPRPSPPYQNHIPDESFARGAFVVVIPNLPPFLDFGWCMDDPAVTLVQHRNDVTGGQRAHSALDIPLTANPDIVPGCLDGYDQPKRALHLVLWQMLNQIKGGGVAVAIELEGT